MLTIIEKQVADHPFIDLQELASFIDEAIDTLIKGRSTDTIRTGYACRASV